MTLKKLWRIGLAAGWLLTLLACQAGIPPTPAPVTPTAVSSSIATAVSPSPTTTPAVTAVSPTPAPTASPIPSPTPTQTAVPASPPTATTPVTLLPVIHTFRASQTSADPGDTIRLEWQVSQAESVSIYHLQRGGPLGEPHWEVGSSGFVTYTIPLAARESDHFMLFATNSAGTSQAAVAITLTCPDDWFFTPSPAGCPASPPLNSAAAWQPFANGQMVWVQAMDAIVVLFADGRSPHWRIFADNWQEGDPVDDPLLTPPAGFYQPVRGFGLVWREQTGVRERLGWALSPEMAFDTAVQRDSPPKYPTTYLAAPDGGVWVLLPEGSGWEKR